MSKDVPAYTLDDYEELVGRFEDAKLESNHILLKVSSRWYALPKEPSLVKALETLRVGQRIGILRIDGNYRIRIEGGTSHD
jgi:hypothetical protein